MDRIFLERAESVLKTVKRGETVTAALSGGADSVFLLLLLISYCGENGINLRAVHVNHCLRGAESDSDENFCRNFCAERNVPLSVKRVDVKAFCAENHLSVEEGARELRYKIFGEITGFVATAHNLNDRAETVILNMARGTGLRGLCSIPERRGNIIRPILDISRGEIEGYLSLHGVPFVTDSTNLSDDYTRNRIRHRILPELCGINGNYLRNIGKMTASLSEDEDFLSGQADKLSADIDELKAAHPAVRKRYLKKKIAEAGAAVNSDRINRASEVIFKGNREQIEGNIFAYIEKNQLRIGEITYIRDLPLEKKPLRFGKNEFSDEKIIILEKVNFQNINNFNNFLTNFILDYDKIQGGLFYRAQAEGDKIQLRGESFHRKIRKIQNSEKIPVHLRRASVIIEDAEEIIFAEYCGAAEKTASFDENGNLCRVSIEYRKGKD